MRSIMSTPMGQNHQQMNQQNNSFDDTIVNAIQMAQSGANMETEFRNQVKQNPQKAQAFVQFMQQYKGKNPWDIVHDVMSKQGINPARYGLPPRF